MRQYTETFSVLEMRKKVGSDDWSVWAKPYAGMFRPAELLAHQSRLTEAIEAAERIQIENYGSMFGVEFRCVTRSVTVTANLPLASDWQDFCWTNG